LLVLTRASAFRAGYILHPAVGDAGLHLCAVLAAGAAPVPVAAAAYTVFDAADAWAGGWGTAATANADDAGSQTSGVTWRGSVARMRRVSTALRGLLSRRTAAWGRAAPPRTQACQVPLRGVCIVLWDTVHTHKPGVVMQDTRMPMYASSRQAVLPASSAAWALGEQARPPLAAGMRKETATLRLWIRAEEPALAAAACLHRLQTLQDGRPTIVVTASRSTSCQPGAGCSAAAAAAQALQRVAAAERGSARLACASICSLTARASRREVMVGLGASEVMGPQDHEGRCVLCELLLPLLPSARRQPGVLKGSMLDGAMGPVIVTGGLGGLGRLSAQWLLLGPAPASLLLFGRSGRAEPGAALLGLVAGPALIQAARCDLATNCEVAASIPRATAALLHAGGLLADGLLERQGMGTLRPVFAPKVAGGRGVLARLAAGAVAATVLFSSIAGLLGSAGQGSYAAANAALDAMACMHSSQVRSISKKLSTSIAISRACAWRAIHQVCSGDSRMRLSAVVWPCAGPSLHKRDVGRMGRSWPGSPICGPPGAPGPAGSWRPRASHRPCCACGCPTRHTQPAAAHFGSQRL